MARGNRYIIAYVTLYASILLSSGNGHMYAAQWCMCRQDAIMASLVMSIIIWGWCIATMKMYTLMHMYAVDYICGSRICIYTIYDGGAWSILDDDDDCSWIVWTHIYISVYVWCVLLHIWYIWCIQWNSIRARATKKIKGFTTACCSFVPAVSHAFIHRCSW